MNDYSVFFIFLLVAFLLHVILVFIQLNKEIERLKKQYSDLNIATNEQSQAILQHINDLQEDNSEASLNQQVELVDEWNKISDGSKPHYTKSLELNSPDYKLSAMTKKIVKIAPIYMGVAVVIGLILSLFTQ